MTDIGKFNKEELSKFLKEQKFADYIGEKFEEENVDGESFLILTGEDLSEMQIKIGDKVKLLKLQKEYLPEEEQSLETAPVNQKSDSKTQENSTDLDTYLQTSEEPNGWNVVHNKKESPPDNARPKIDSLMPHHPQNSDSVMVTLNAIVPAYSWGWNGSKCSLLAYFGAEELGGWRSAKFKLEQKFFIQKGYVVLTGTAPIEVRILKKYGSTLSYRYEVDTPYSSFSHDKYERLRHVPCKYGIKAVYRVLIIPAKDLYSGGISTHYDTVIYPREPVSFASKRSVNKSVNQFLKVDKQSDYLDPVLPESDDFMRRKAMHVYLSYICNVLVNGGIYNQGKSELAYLCREVPNIFHQVCKQSVEFVYHNGETEKYIINGEISSLNQCMYEWLENAISQAKQKQTNDEESQVLDCVDSYVLSGVVFAYIVDNLKFLYGFMTLKESQGIVELLKLHPEITNDARHCRGYDMLHTSVLQDEFKTKLAVAIRNLCEHVISKSNGKDFSWLWALPLLHFLSGQSEPFRSLPSDHTQIKWNFSPLLEKVKKYFREQFNDRKRFENFWRSYNDQRTLDPELSKVLMFLCPPNELHFILQEVPPIVATSYFTHMNSSEDKKKLEAKQLQPLKDRLNGIKHAIEKMNEEDWDAQGPNIFSATIIMVEAIMSRIQSCSAHHIQALQALLEYLLHIVSHVNNQNLIEPSDGVGKISDLFANWIRHFNVIGSSCFGGSRALKFKEELSIWKIAFKVYPSVGELDMKWKELLEKILETRTQEVDDDKKVSVFLSLNPNDTDCPQVIVDVFMRMGMKGLEEQSATDDQLKGHVHNGQAEHVGKLLSKYLNKHCDSLNLYHHVTPIITIEELLSWKLWPIYIEHCRNGDAVFKAMESRERKIAEAAFEMTRSLMQKIKIGEVSCHYLKIIIEHREAMEKLTKASSSICDITKIAHRLKELDEHVAAVGLMFDNIHHGVQGYSTILRQLEDPVENKSMNVLCLDWAEKGELFVVCSALGPDSQLYSILKPFTIMHKSEVFRRQWNCRKDQVKDNTSLSHKDFVEKVWRPSINECYCLLKDCVNGSAVVADVISVLHNPDKAEVKRNLVVLRDCLIECFPSKPPPAPMNDEWIAKICESIEHYQKACHCNAIAVNLLKLQSCLKFTGNYKRLSDFAKMDISKYKLMEIDDDFISAGETLIKVSDKNNCDSLESLIKNWEVVEWMKTNFKEIDQVRVFVDVALTATEDPLTTQKLTALRIVGNAVADFVGNLQDLEDYSLQSVVEQEADVAEDNNDKSQELIKLCENFWLALDQHSQLPTFLRECNVNREWYKNIKDAQRDVHQHTLKELSRLNSEGCYIIGKKGDELLTNISNAFQLTFTTGVDRAYDLEMIRDLESRLVMLAGKNTREVQTFFNVFQAVYIISDTLVKLHNHGCVQFIGWEYWFHCGQDSIQQLRDEQKHLLRQLKIWEEAIYTARNDCYLLNSFTVQQLLLLRKELVPKCYDNGEYKVNLHAQAIALLKCLYPCTEVRNLEEVVRISWLRLEESSDNVDVKRNEKTSIIETTSSAKRTALTCEGIVETVLTPHERIVYIKLTKTNGFNSIVVIAEILQRSPRANSDEEAEQCTNEISNKILEMAFAKRQPSDMELVQVVNHSLPSDYELQLEGSEDAYISSDDTESQHLDDDNRSVFSDTSAERITVADMLERRRREYLSLNQLAQILVTLEQELKTEILLRKPREITEIDVVIGSPNLFVIEDEYVIPLTLKMYASDEKQPLPTQEEVLVCNEETTAEQVILFLRRSIFDPELKRIFCLVHGEKLSYSVCEQVLKELAKLKQGKSGYRLIIVCSNESERRSHLVTSLHNFKRPNPDISSEVLKKYLQDHLIEPKHTSIGTSPAVPALCAHSIDPQQSYVRIVKSYCPGMGKSLYIKRMGEKLKDKTKRDNFLLSIPVPGPAIEVERILETLCETSYTKIIHFDIAPSMARSVTSFLFSVLVLGHLSDHKGRTWRREMTQMYCIEMTIPLRVKKEVKAVNQLIHLFPSAHCHPPTEDKAFSKLSGGVSNVGMDLTILEDRCYQRVYHYLEKFANRRNLDLYLYSFHDKITSPVEFIRVILRSHPAKSWTEFSHYIQFLNIQLLASETSSFCDVKLMGNNWNGIKSFVLRMMIIMSKEFTSSSLVERQDDSQELVQFTVKQTHEWNKRFHPYLFFNRDQASMTFMGFYINELYDAIDPATGKTVCKHVISDQLCQELYFNGVNFGDDYQKWRKEKLLINLGNVIGLDLTDGAPVKDPDSSYVITVDNVMKMMAILMRFRCGIPVVMMGETGCGKTRLLKYLCQLAAQNLDRINFVALKVHGGTTKSDIEKAVRKAEVLASKEALGYANEDKNTTKEVFGTVLFFDEANTTEHINLIKEIVCDRSMHGNKLHDDLRMVAACNPYRRHSDEMIRKLDSAGLGFHKKSCDAREKLGTIPLRELVYRVHELPPSMMPLIFDFGRLDDATEEKYIQEMVKNQISLLTIQEPVKKKFHYELYIDVIATILSWSQRHMRENKNECSFVSLRDIDRAMIVFRFFLEKMDIFGSLMDKKAKQMKYTPVKCKVTRSLLLTLAVCYNARLQQRQHYESGVVSLCKDPLVVPSKEREKIFVKEVTCCQEVILDCMKLGRNIAKNAALRENVFMMLVCISVRIPLFLIGKPGSSKSLAKSIILNSMKGKNSESSLLKEFMEVQIFSYQCSQISTSESIIKVFDQAKKVQDQSGDKSKFVSVVVLDEVGLAEDSPNLPLKVLHPLLEDGTEGNSYSIDVVEREERVAFIGISNWALDPAKMNRGIMVTRCDPTREELELSAKQICTNHGNEKDDVAEWLKLYFSKLAKAYLKILSKQKREFFGLRDFYSLVKMLYWMCKNAREPPTWQQIEHAIRRNFGGFDEFDVLEVFMSEIHMRIQPPEKTKSHQIWRERLHIEYKNLEDTKRRFYKKYKSTVWNNYNHKKDGEKECKRAFNYFYGSGDLHNLQLNENFQKHSDQYFKKKFEGQLWPYVINPSCSPNGLVEASLANKETTTHGESRYLLFLTENYAALQTLQHFLETPNTDQTGFQVKRHMKPYVLFGSSFPKDKDYTQVCHNINTIKVCMETGRPVILLNLDHLYESLYDALNQYYMYFGDLRYVDLGLRNHRFNCFVHDDFKLILIAEKQKVYDEFPTPLINRLEKHFVVTSTILTQEQLKLKEELTTWVNAFIPDYENCFTPKDSFIGYQEDTPAAVVFRASKIVDCSPESPKWHQEVLEICKYLLLQLATPDALIRLKKCAKLKDEYERIADVYSKQHHSSLREFLFYHLETNAKEYLHGCRMQVTTYNELLSVDEIEEIRKHLQFEKYHVISCLLQEFDTEFEFSRNIREAVQMSRDSKTLLIVQCDSGHLDSDLIACAKYRVDDIREEQFHELQDSDSDNDDDIQSFNGCCHVLFAVLIPREHNNSSFVGFLGGEWICAHIDDFCPIYNFSSENLLVSSTPLSFLFYDPPLGSSFFPTLPEPQDDSTIDALSQFRSVNYCQNLYKLIQKSVQEASSDPESPLAKRSHKINSILYHLLTVHPPMKCDFYVYIVYHIWEYMKKKEPREKEWIIDAASNRSRLQEGGAFLQVLLHKLDEVIVEVFAKIIAFIDQANNLSLIDPTKEPHLDAVSFWIDAFSTPAICSFDSSTWESNTQFHVNINNYSCKFPFFWVIQKTVNELLHQHHLTTGMGEERMLTVEHFTSLRKHPIGILLNRTSGRYMKMRYLNDLIQFSWTHTITDKYVNMKEIEIISAVLNSVANTLLQPYPEYTFFSDIICAFHFAVQLKFLEVRHFIELVSVLPEIVEKIGLKRTDENELNISSDLPLDVLATTLSLREIDSDNKEDYSWLISKLHRYYQVYNVIDTIMYSTEHEKILSERPKWMGIQAVYMFIEHIVMNNTKYFYKTVQYSNRIRLFMSQSGDFTKKSAVIKIEFVLSQMYQEFSKTHSKVSAETFAQSCIRFYIEIISKLSMGKTAPEDELIEKLLDTVFTTGPDKEGLGIKDLTPFLESENDSVPVVRSFLLQLLLRNNYKSTREHITMYFEKAHSALSLQTSTDSDVLIQLKLLYSQLYEDSLYERYSNLDKINQVNMLIHIAVESKECLSSLPNPLNESNVVLEVLERVGGIRFVLNRYTEWIDEKYFTRASVDTSLSEQCDRLQCKISELCLEKSHNTKSFGPQVFLLKVLFRRYGETAMQNILSDSSMRFLTTGLATTFHEVFLVDQFVIYGTQYTNEMKVLITEVSIDRSDQFLSLKQFQPTSPTLLVCFAMSIFMEVTQTYAKAIEDPTRIPGYTIQAIVKHIKEILKFYPEIKSLISALLNNNFSGGGLPQLFVQPAQSLVDRMYSSVVVHVAVGFLARKYNSLLQPFCLMLTNPHVLKNAYMPAMPDDVISNLTEGKVYECPNGHPYLITECGRPVTTRNCPDCEKAVAIGGKKYKLSKRNQLLKRKPKPQTGYILGVATESPAVPERSLTPAACTVIKILMHSALVWTCCSKPDQADSILAIVKTRVASDLPIFFWEHLTADIQCLQTSLSIGFDDAVLLIHVIIQRIVETPTTKETVGSLDTLDERNIWEIQFNQTYIQPVLENFHMFLENARKQILDDKQKHPPILDIVYERNIVKPDIQHSLWKYRPNINLEHLSQKILFEGYSSRYPALVFFLKEETSLRATKYLPSIVKLQRFLYDVHHYRSSEEEVQEKTIGQFLNEISNDETRNELNSLIENVQQAWLLVRGKLQTYGRLPVPQEYINVDLSDETTSIAYLIPKTTGRGCCTTALVDHLVMIHNEFIDICMKIIREMPYTTGKTWKSVWRDPSVQLKDLRDTQLLQYENRLMAVILAHCHYSLTVGQQHTDVEYDYAALEKHLLNEFVYGKPKIQLDIPHVVFRKDVYTGERFETIRTKVPQMHLSAGDKGDILKQLTRIQQLRQALNHIDVVMGFLSAGGKENPNMSLNHYATKMLKIHDFNKVIGTGYCIGHILALWDIVAVELARKVTLTGEVPYSVNECLQEHLSTDIVIQMNEDLEHVNLDVVLSTLNDFIETHVRNINEADHRMEWTIKDCLEGHLGIFPGDEYELEKEIKFLQEIPMSQVIEVWKVVVFYKKKLSLETGGQR